MLKLPRLVQYDISNLTGTYSMKTPLAQGCREHSRHAPKAMGAGASAVTAPRHTPASLGHGDGSENSGPRGVRGAPEGTGFPVAALLPVPGPTPDTAEKGARLAALVLRAMAWPRSARGDDGPCAHAARALAPAALPRVPGQGCPMVASAEGSVGGCRGMETPGERDNSARVHVRGHPRCANMPLQLSGTRHLRRNRLAL